MTEHVYPYTAFISYSQDNKKFAYALHDGLPKLKIPKDSPELAVLFKEKITYDRLFIDQKGIRAGSDLGEILGEKLRQSEFLIVVCTPEAVQSEWVNQEIQYFKQHRDPKNIITCVYSGRPDWFDKENYDDQCIPKALRIPFNQDEDIAVRMEHVPAWVDFRKKSAEGHKTAMARVACGLLYMEPNDFVKFHALRNRRKLQFVIIFLASVALTFAGISYFAHEQGKIAVKNETIAITNEKIAAENQKQAVKNDALSLAYLAERDASQGRIRSAVQKGAEAFRKNNNLVTRTSLWESLSALVGEEVIDYHKPLYGRGLHFFNDEQLAVVTDKKVAIRAKDGTIHWGNHGAGLSLSSAMSSDGKSLFILGEKTGRLERWDSQTGQSVLLHEQGQSCSWMAKARHRDRLVMGCQDGEIFVYDVTENNTLHPVWQANKRPPGSTSEAVVGISNDGSLIFWVYGSGILYGWNIEGDRMAWETSAAPNSAEIQVSHNGNWLIWYTQDGQVTIVNIHNGQQLGHKSTGGAILALALAPDDDRVALAVKWPPEANRSPGILEWNLETGRDTLVYEAPEFFNQVAYSPSGNLYGLIVKGAVYRMIPSPERRFAATSNAVLKLWPGDASKKGWFALVCGKQKNPGDDISFGKKTRLLSYINPIPTVDADFQCISQGSGHLLWFPEDLSHSEMIPGSEEATAAAKLANGQLLVGTRDGQVMLITPGQPEKSQTLLPKPLGKSIHFISHLHDDFVVLSLGIGAEANGIYRLNAQGLSPYFLFREYMNSNRWLSLGEVTNALSLSESGRVLLAFNSSRYADPNGDLFQFDLQNKEVLNKLSHKGGVVRDIVLLPKKNRLALAMNNGRIALLNPRTWQLETEWVNGDVPVTALATWTQADGSTILLASDSQGTLTLRNLDDEKEFYRTLPMPGSIISQSLKMENDLLALGSPQGITTWHGLLRPKFPENSPDHPWLGSHYVPELITQAKQQDASGKIPLLQEALRVTPWDLGLRTLLSKALAAKNDLRGALEQEDLSFQYATTLFDPRKDAASLWAAKLGNTATKFNLYLDWWKKSEHPQVLVEGITLVLARLHENPQSPLLHFQFQIGLLAAGQFETLLSWLPQSLSIQNRLDPGIPNPKILERFGIWSAFLLNHPERVTPDMVNRAYDPSDRDFTPGKRIIRQLLLEPDNLTYRVSDMDKEERETADAETAIINLLTGLAHQRNGRNDAALSAFHYRTLFDNNLKREKYYYPHTSIY